MSRIRKLGVALVALCFLLFAQHRASTVPSSPFDQYGNICWENEKARLDNFAIQLQNYQSATGEIIVYAGEQSCNGEAKYRGNRARNWVLKRGLDPKRVVVKDGGYLREMSIYLIVRPQGADPYDTPPSLPKKEVSIKRCVDKVFKRVLCLDHK